MNLNQITVPTSNLEASVTFYKTLGMQLIVLAAPRYARFELPQGDATFSLHLVDEINPSNGIYVYFECDDLDDRVADLITKGIEFDELPSDRTWLWREARLKDPDGNQLLFYHAGDNRKNPPWRLEDKA